MTINIGSTIVGFFAMLIKSFGDFWNWFSTPITLAKIDLTLFGDFFNLPINQIEIALPPSYILCFGGLSLIFVLKIVKLFIK